MTGFILLSILPVYIADHCLFQGNTGLRLLPCHADKTKPQEKIEHTQKLQRNGKRSALLLLRMASHSGKQPEHQRTDSGEFLHIYLLRHRKPFAPPCNDRGGAPALRSGFTGLPLFSSNNYNTI